MAPLSAAFTTLALKPELTLVYKPSKQFKFLQNNEFFENKNLTITQFKNSFTEFLKKKKRKKATTELKRLGNDKLKRF